RQRHLRHSKLLEMIVDMQLVVKDVAARRDDGRIRDVSSMSAIYRVSGPLTPEDAASFRIACAGDAKGAGVRALAPSRAIRIRAAKPHEDWSSGTGSRVP